MLTFVYLKQHILLSHFNDYIACFLIKRRDLLIKICTFEVFTKRRINLI